MRALAISLCAVAWMVPAQHPNRITALVTVLSETGEPVRTLKPSDFIVKEGGATREVIEAVVADDEISVALLVDTAQPPMGSQAPVTDLRSGLAAFVSTLRAHEPKTAISLMTFGGAAVPVARFDAPAAALDEAIARLYPDQSSHGVLLEALSDAAHALRQRPMPRRAIVSVDLHSTEFDNEAGITRATNDVSGSGATYWALSVRGTGESVRQRDAVLDALTKSTGGQRFFLATAAGLAARLTQTAATLSSQYSVTFARPSNRPLGAVRVECRCGNRVLLSPMMR